MFGFKVYFAKRREQKRIAKQYALEKNTVEYFKTSASRLTVSLEDLAGNINLPDKGVYMLGKFNKTSFPMQAVRLHRLWECGELVLSYGDYTYRSPIEWLTPIENFPEKLWFSVEDYQRPTRPALLLCDYGSGHYEVVEYSNKTWVTELSFPTKPTRYFVLDFLNKEKNANNNR